jgi:threonine aldolase
VIDLRSDTQTRPTQAMREAMAQAEVGDEQEREDPTVLELERRGAELLGQEEAVYLPTATMGNQIALAILGERGTELVVEERAHIMVSELGGAAMHSGLQTRGLSGYRGRLTSEQLRATAWSEGDFWSPRISVLALENTHNTAGGTVWPLEELRGLTATARELGVRTHLDGARLMNAAVASGVPASEIAGLFDTATLCLSKGLGCPLGALIAGSRELMHRARVEKHRFGGAMRQAGIVAAAGLYALDHNVERLADDHARARRLAEGWAAAGVPVDVELVESNFVQVDVREIGIDEHDALARIRDEGVLLSQTRPGVIRAVTHLDIDDDDVERALAAVPRALGSVVRA